MPDKTINEMLRGAFPRTHADAAVKHFRNMVDDYQKSEWADATAKSGKFIEAVMKALWVHVGETVPSSKEFSVGKLIDRLQQKPSAAGIPDSIKLTIPRACRFAYEIASNRGARHDAQEVDANEMDASVVVSICSWILSEMVRFSQKQLDLAAAKAMVKRLMQRRYPFTEEIDGRVYTEIGRDALDVGLAILHFIYPERMSREELADSLERHGYSRRYSRRAVQRLKPYVDADPAGKVRLRNTGIQRVEALVSETPRPREGKRKRRRR